MSVTVAVDAMGGDFGPTVTVPAALALLAELEDARVILVGDEPALRAQLAARRGLNHPRIEIVASSEVVGSDELPSVALRGKKDSSMRVAINLVKSGRAAACVSAGNTGALMAIARFVLKTLPGIERPAIATALPTLRGQTTVLDLGANINCSAAQLYQFGIMGAALVAATQHCERPSVGLLSIGEEEIKGNDVVKEAAELLRKSDLNFIGNVEGDDIYKGTADVVVCDGFVGNVALKTSEGLAQMLVTFLKEAFKRNLLTKLVALIAMPALRGFRHRVDPRRYNGASLLGLRGIVMKSHGGTDVLGFQCALRRAYEEAHSGVLERIARHVTRTGAHPALAESQNV